MNSGAEAEGLTPKMERFALAIVEGDNQSDAYRSAYCAKDMGDESIAIEASRLMRDPRIAARIKELRNSLQRSLGISRASLLRELDEVAEQAKTNGDLKMQLHTIMSKARLLGFLALPGKPMSANQKQASADLGIFSMDGNSE